MDKQAVLAEIRAYRESMACASEIQAEDVTYRDLQAEFHCGRNAAKDLAGKLLESGKFERHMVRGPNGKLVAVFRRVRV